MQPAPIPLGLRASFGFGDRLGPATPGHIDACRKGPFAPVFAQQSARELERTNRTPEAVMAAAASGIQKAGWSDPFGADADHLKTRHDVERFADAGFTFFTIDPSDHVDDRADLLPGEALAAAAREAARAGGFFALSEVESLYLGRSFDLARGESLGFGGREALYRALVKYGEAIAFAQEMAEWIGQATGDRGAEIELSLDETDTPTTPVEHLFVALELKRRKIRIISLAPRFPGDFEKGIDYKGDLAEFEAVLERHAAVAETFGPYKISVHSGSDKCSLYPILGRVCGEGRHVKTAGTSYLEALRVVSRKDEKLFREIIDYARTRFDQDRASYHISAERDRIPPSDRLKAGERESAYLDGDDGRQLLHVTYGSILTQGRTHKGRPFKEALLEVLDRHALLHRQLLAEHLGRHIEGLMAG